MDCKECDGLLVAYVKGELSKEDGALVKRHLAECESCRWNEQAARRMVELIGESDDETVINQAKTIIQEAICSRASDIHLDPTLREMDEPAEEGQGRISVRVRYRIDGVLHDVQRLSYGSWQALCRRLMVMSEMNPFERRIPQFGRIHIRHRDRDYDLRFGTLPTTSGMRIVMRILDKSSALFDLDELGLSETNRARVREVTARPWGVFLIAGPAGGGRTSFAYSLLNRLVKPATSILTIEDPVEVTLPGISHTHVNRKAGMDYPEALKAMMRQDPDIILCGEVTSSAVADLLNQIAATGHLVLAPVLGNDATDGLGRYLDLGTDPLTTGQALIGAVGMRLVRKVCAECAEAVEPSAADIEFLRRGGVEKVPQKLRRGTGCDRCRQTGYVGRTGIHEVLLIGDDLRERIQLGKADPEEFRAAIKPSMIEDAAAKAADGITTVEEAVRVTAAVGQS
jgi:type IV pilus assembly protein PilB